MKNELDTLLAAYQASPENHILFGMLLQAFYEDIREAEILPMLLEFKGILQGKDTLIAATLLNKHGHFEKALEFCIGTAPELLVQKAIAFAGMNKFVAARALYEQATEQDPYLLDDELEERLHLEIPPLEQTKNNVYRFKRPNDEDSDKDLKINPFQPNIAFADVGGMDEIKKQIQRRIILPFQKPELFARFGRQAGGGMLFYGPPGCGKTLIAKATAGECGAKFISVPISEILDMYMGESEKRLHNIFEHARRNSPTVLFFDEIEILAGNRSATARQLENVISQFLLEMDSPNNKDILIIGATNTPWFIDSAFKRPGRFDVVQLIAPPDLAAREAILKIHLKDKPAGELDLSVIAADTAEYSGADLKSLIDCAADIAIDETIVTGQDTLIEQTSLLAANKKVKPSTKDWFLHAKNYALFSNEDGQYNDILDYLNVEPVL